jgi:predicted PurR-regulated permease PerM
MTSIAYRMVPASRRARVQVLSDEILLRIGGFVGGQLTIASLSGLSTLVMLTILQVPYAISLAMLVALFGLIPLIGATLGAIAVVVVGLTQSTTIAIVLFIFYVIYQQFENYIIAPRVMRKAVNVPAVVTIVAALLGASLLGLLGGLIAIPLAAAVLLIIQQVVIPQAETK